MSTTIDNAPNAVFQGNAPGNLVTTTAEARQGVAADGTSAAPEGALPVVIEQGDTLSGIMASYGLDWNDRGQREAFLAANPQFADVQGGRNPDLIWPGEVVYVPGADAGASEPGAETGTGTDGVDGSGDGGATDPQATPADVTDESAQALVEAQNRSAVNDSQSTARDNAIADAQAATESAIRDELAAGTDPAAIEARLRSNTDLSDEDIAALVAQAQTAASPTNPVGGSRNGAPLSQAHASNEAVAGLVEASTASVSTDSQATHQEQLVENAEADVVESFMLEMAQGVSAEALKARYGNDPQVNALVDQAAGASTPGATAEAGQALAEAQGASVSTDSQATAAAERTAEAEAALETQVRDALAAGADPATLRAQLRVQTELSDEDIDRIVGQAQTAASPTNPVGGSREGAPLSPAYTSNQAVATLDGVSGETPSTDSQATNHAERLHGARVDVIEAFMTELSQGVSADALKARYGNDPAVSELVDEAVAQS